MTHVEIKTLKINKLNSLRDEIPQKAWVAEKATIFMIIKQLR